MISICVIGWLKVTTIEVDLYIFATHQMSKCNGYCCSDSDEDEENMIEEHLVDSLPNSAINLLYYIEPHTIYHLQPHIYYIDDIYLYTRCENGYYRYNLEPIRYMRIPLRLKNSVMHEQDFDAVSLYQSTNERTVHQVVYAEVELLLTDERIRDDEYINVLRHNVYSTDGSIEYFASANNSDEEPFDEELDKLLFS